ncbi:MAG TPA: cupin domain-containing protein [Pusillimonas sp.]|uniref:cupin domain-containing protein n=1 Tax=unclassified Pusillimonas TaxID=2640016 RepID=UPI0026048728|nr:MULTISPECIES: cupin domain-containing protein [unclassified Pusillimonas]HLU18904.1 cupin domain-containing protein [Pusillimonas sp.]
MLNTTQKVVTLNPDMTSAAVQGIPQFMGISGKSAGSTGIAMNITAFGPGGKAKVHYHSGFETAIYGLVGTTVLYWGEQLENMCRIDPGVFCFIPPDTPHIAFNLSDTEPAYAVSCRNDPVEQENVVLVPELDGLRDADAAAYKAQEANKQK